MSRYRKRLFAMLLAGGMLFTACGSQTAANEATEAAADGTAEAGEAEGSGTSSEVSTERAQEAEPTINPTVEISAEGLTPVYPEELADGEYEIEVESSSTMFKIEKCILTVKGRELKADMTMSGTGYLYLFMGKGEAATEEQYIPFIEGADGKHHYIVPVKALNTEIDCAAFSKAREQWYDRTLIFKAAGLPPEAYVNGVTAASLGLADGEYTVDVTLSGGSGKAYVETPARLTVKDGEASADIIFSSPNYDYMIVDRERYEPVNTEGNSEFVIPVAAFDMELTVYADTTAMSVPHEIEYTLYFDSATIQEADAEGTSMELSYAKEFSVDYLKDGAALIRIGQEDSFLLVPEKMSEDKVTALIQGTPAGTVVLRKPLTRIYAASSSAVDLLYSAGGLQEIFAVSTKESDWALPYMREAQKNGDVRYVGKYSAPDTETLLNEGCDLAIENTMIYHSPQTKEQLEAMGIPVLVERSSYEAHPLGRLEWVRLYGLLLGREKEADAFFQEKLALLSSLSNEPTGKTAVFFNLSPNGYVSVRKPGDYVAEMIRMAGGTYAFTADSLSVDEDALSTMRLQAEVFYAGAKDTDVLFYNSTVYGGPADTDALIEECALLADFKAVKEGNVWCTDRNVFQEVSALADMIGEMHAILSGDADEDTLTYFYHVN